MNDLESRLRGFRVHADAEALRGPVLEAASRAEREARFWRRYWLAGIAAIVGLLALNAGMDDPRQAPARRELDREARELADAVCCDDAEWRIRLALTGRARPLARENP